MALGPVIDQRVSPGQLIADRTRDRARLETQHQQLTLTRQKLQTATLTVPLQPATVPASRPISPFCWPSSRRPKRQ